MALTYFWGSINYMIYAIFAVGFGICFFRGKEKSALWLALIQISYIAVGMFENFSVLTSSYALSYFGVAFAATLIMQLAQTYLYYRAIAALGKIELQRRDTYFLAALFFFLLTAAGIPQTRGVYHFLLYTVMLWGVLRLYPGAKRDVHAKYAFFAIGIIFALQMANFLAFILNHDHAPLETRTLLDRQNGVLYLVLTVFEMLCTAAELRYQMALILHRQPRRESEGELQAAPDSEISENRDLMGMGLTDRECEILEMIMNGMGNREIAETLYIAEGTVKTHIHHIYKKLGITSRGQLIKLVRQSQREPGHAR